MKKDKLVNVTEAGRRGGRARAEKLTPAQRKRAARKAVNARWKRWREANPEKVKARQTKRRAV